MGEFKSFYKTVGGNEGNKCNYPTRLDTYGCGCQHDCSYCYAKSLLDFRGLWNYKEPAVADIDKIRKKISKLERGSVVRLGGMTDCFGPIEKEHGVTRETIKALNERGIEYLIVTKSDLIVEYIDILDRDLAHIQVSITFAPCEKAVPMIRRIEAVEKLNAEGFDVAVRLSPYIPQFVDYEKLSQIKCDKVIVEFLRVNHWIEKWLPLDYSEYTLKHAGYKHLPLDKKLEYLSKVTPYFNQVSVCEDVDEHYEYWKEAVNFNKDDCCNLRRGNRE